eukprot:4908137-Amphidinium_carterae.1
MTDSCMYRSGGDPSRQQPPRGPITHNFAETDCFEHPNTKSVQAVNNFAVLAIASLSLLLACFFAV